MRFPLSEPSEVLLEALADALDEVDFALVLLNPDMRVRFANRRFGEVLGFPAALLASGPSIREMLEHAAFEGYYDLPALDLREYVAGREAAIRAGPVDPTVVALADGRRLLFQCAVCRDGGRLMTYTDISGELQREEAEVVQRINAELRFNTETLEDHAAHLAELAEAAEDSAQRAELARVALEREIAERRQLEEKLRELATTDALTGALNRAELMAVAERERGLAARHGRDIAVLMVDVDHFKAVNDHYGHAGGDRALQHLVALLAGTVRTTDAIGRMGGEEFVVVLPATNAAAAEGVAERLRAVVEETPVSFRGAEIRITISIGVAEFQPSDTSIEAAIDRADDALYAAKKCGRNRVVRAGLPAAA